MPPVKHVALHTSATCAIDVEDRLWCWGILQPAARDLTILDKPTLVAGPATVRDVAVGPYHGCALDTQGGVWCWGYNEHGQLGRGAGSVGEGLRPPARVPGAPAAAGIAVADRSSYAWTTDGKVFRWGDVFGNDKTVHAPSAVEVTGIGPVERVHASGEHACALLEGGDVRCWIPESLDELAAGQRLDIGFPATGPLLLPDARGVHAATQLLVQNHDACALVASGEVVGGRTSAPPSGGPPSLAPWSKRRPCVRWKTSCSWLGGFCTAVRYCAAGA